MFMKPEDLEQIALIEWMKLKFPKESEFLYFIKNESKCSYVEGKKAKRMGKKKGISDLLFTYPHKRYRGMWIELKSPPTSWRKGGKPTKEQLNFLEQQRQAGYHAEFYIGWHQAAKAIEEYLNEST